MPSHSMSAVLSRAEMCDSYSVGEELMVHAHVSGVQSSCSCHPEQETCVACCPCTEPVALSLLASSNAMQNCSNHRYGHCWVDLLSPTTTSSLCSTTTATSSSSSWLWPGRLLPKACLVSVDPMLIPDEDSLGTLEEELLAEEVQSGARIVPQSEVMRSQGEERARWYDAAHEELLNFKYRGVFAPATRAERELASPLPVKCVWALKKDGRRRCRAVVCGNFQSKNTKELVYTAQVDVSTW